MHRIQLKARSIVYSVSITFGVGFGLMGCASSEKASFTNHLTATVPAGPAGNDDVIMAFSLDPLVPSSAVARGSDSQQRE